MKKNNSMKKRARAEKKTHDEQNSDSLNGQLLYFLLPRRKLSGRFAKN